MSDAPECRPAAPAGHTVLCFDESGEYVLRVLRWREFLPSFLPALHLCTVWSPDNAHAPYFIVFAGISLLVALTGRFKCTKATTMTSLPVSMWSTAQSPLLQQRCAPVPSTGIPVLLSHAHGVYLLMQGAFLVIGGTEHLVSKYSMPDADYEGRAGKMTTAITCVDFEAGGARLAIAAEYVLRCIYVSVCVCVCVCVYVSD